MTENLFVTIFDINIWTFSIVQLFCQFWLIDAFKINLFVLPVSAKPVCKGHSWEWPKWSLFTGDHFCHCFGWSVFYRFYKKMVWMIIWHRNHWIIGTNVSFQWCNQMSDLHLQLKWICLTWCRFVCKHDMSHVMRKSVYAICEQQRRRSACASAQSDQRLCCSLPG